MPAPIPYGRQWIDDADVAAVVECLRGDWLTQGPAVERFEQSLREAAATPEGRPWYRAVYAGEEPVGFVMLSWDLDPAPPGFKGPWFLWKLLIDHRHQGKGYGREVVRQVVEIVRAEGGAELLTSHVVGDGGPAGFYERLGFVPTGELDPDGEVLLRLTLG